MQLSVIIVNYNVSHFLEQCLISVFKAAKNEETEVWVVDNNSVDDSVEMVKSRFPEVKIIENKTNLGFSKANNQAIKRSTGKYVLLLNPDTVVETDTFEKTIRFMEEHPQAGGLGVKMLDGSGKFLPESKRGLPTPATAFYKIFGLARLFPRSKKFSRYHMGFLDENEVHEVDVLAGAFMLMRKSVLDKIGLLDESFFMYGEDVDLSYRIMQAGYKNYYFPKTRIIHYKGESTRKSSVNYVLVFYKAMIIFARKHFTGKNARLLTFFINIAVYFRAFLALISRFFTKVGLPLLDIVLMLGGAWAIMILWQENIISKQGGVYPDLFIWVYIPVYVVIWVLSIFYSGGYDKPVKIRKSVQGVLLGTVFILIVYSLLSENMRFSRGQILVDTIWALISLPIVRYGMSGLNISGFQLENKKSKRILIIGDEDEAGRVKNILEKTYLNIGFTGLVYYTDEVKKLDDFVGTIHQVKDIVTIYQIDEVIFCSKNLTQQTIIDKMSEWQALTVEYKIAQEDSLSIIGGSSIHNNDELYTVGVNPLYTPANKRNKRLLDLTFSFTFLFFSPILIFFMQNKNGFIRNIFSVLTGTKSWVGCEPTMQKQTFQDLTKPGVLSPIDWVKDDLSEENIKKLNLLYVRDYSLLRDINLIFFSFKYLGSR